MKSLIKKDPEKAFLSYYGYDDGRNIKMKDMVGMFSALNELEPEVAIKAIEQFPEMAKTTVSMAKQFCEVSLDTLKKHQESSKDTLMFLRERATFIEGLVNAGFANEEERRYFIDKLMELSEMAVEVHKNDQNFFLKFVSENGRYILGMVAFTAITLGVNAKFKMPDLKEEAA